MHQSMQRNTPGVLHIHDVPFRVGTWTERGEREREEGESLRQPNRHRQSEREKEGKRER